MGMTQNTSAPLHTNVRATCARPSRGYDRVPVVLATGASVLTRGAAPCDWAVVDYATLGEICSIVSFAAGYCTCLIA